MKHLKDEDFERAIDAIKRIVKGDHEAGIPIQSLNALYQVGEWFDEYRSKQAAQRVLDKPKQI
jgi:hypothetical protein